MITMLSSLISLLAALPLEGGGGRLFLIIIVAVLPALLLGYYLWYIDSKREPAVWLIGSVVLGALVSLPVVYLKGILSSVLFSLCMVILYWKTRNVWALALVRGICEFFGMVPGTIFANADIGGYAGSRGGITVSLVFFAIRTFVALIMLVLILKNALKGLDLTKLRREW